MIVAVGVVAVLVCHRPDDRLCILGDVQQSRALGSQEPFMAARSVGVAPEFPNIHADRSDGLRSVHNAHQPARPRQRGDLGDRHAQPGGRKHMTHTDNSRPLANALRESVHDDRRAVLCLRYGDHVHLHTVMAREILPAMQPARVFLIGEQDAVARAEAKTLGNRVHAGRGTAGQRQLVEIAAEELRRDGARVLAHRLPRQLAVVRDRILLERRPRSLCRIHGRPARWPDRAGVEVRQAVAEEELALRGSGREGLRGRHKTGRGAARERVQELPAISGPGVPAPVHWFCPRSSGSCGSSYFFSSHPDQGGALERHLQRELHDPFAGACQWTAECCVAGQRGACDAVVGGVDTADVVPVQEVERFPDQLGANGADTDVPGDPGIERDDRRQPKLITHGARSDVVSRVAIAVEIHRADSGGVGLAGLRGEDRAERPAADQRAREPVEVLCETIG